METHLALIIIGTVLSLVGILFFLVPEKVNEKVMTDLSDSAVQPAAALRSVLGCLLYTSPSPRDATLSRMPSSA